MNPVLSLAIAAVATLAVMSFFIGLMRLMKPEGELQDRLDGLNQSRSAPAQPTARQRSAKALDGFAHKLSFEQRLGQKTALSLTQADLALTVNEYTLLRIGAAAGGALLGAFALGSFLFAIPVGLLGFQLPVIWVQRRRRARQQHFQGQLVDVLSMLVSGLRAGVGLMQGMDLVRHEMPAPASEEFGKVVREVGLGASLEDALTHLLERMPGDDLGMIITVIKIQAEVGGNLADVLEGVISTIRERVRIFQEIRSLTAQQRVAGYMLAGLPFFVGAATSFINPGYIGPLFTMQWIWLPGIALMMILAGFILIQRIVDIKV